MRYLTIGKIVSTHGNKGEVKVYPLTDFLERFDNLKEVYVRIKGQIKLYKIENVRYHKKFIILKFEGIDSIDKALSFKDSVLEVKRENAFTLPPGHYYISDIIGCKVKTIEGKDLGELIDVIKTGANDVYIVKNDANKEILIPAIKEVVKKIDIKNREITIKPLEGMI
ncbi:MAG: rRNA processing protein RimM [Thermosediminibacterales bacterium]|nr:rRNA processing protein RimM [Thermosediminibacterales bacterium]MDK2835890.1 rRNA processing protein RimM [Thermosediminibacterales bacterium]